MVVEGKKKKKRGKGRKSELLFFLFSSLFSLLSLLSSLSSLSKLTHRGSPRQAQAGTDRLVRPLRLQQQGDAPDVFDVVHRQHVRGGDLAEQRQLVPHGALEGGLGAAGEEVGRDAQRAEHADRVLRRLGLLLSHDAQDGHQRHMDRAEVSRSDPVVELAEGLDERRTLDVADGAALLVEGKGEEGEVERKKGGEEERG